MAGAAELEAELEAQQDGNASIPPPVKLFDNCFNAAKSE